MAAAISDGLSGVSAGAAFASRYADFEAPAPKSQWSGRQGDGLPGQLVTYHRSWPYFARAFGCQVMDFVEPKPGVPPTPKHVEDLTAEMKAQSVRLLIVEPYFDPKLPQQIAHNTGAALVILPPSVGASKEVTSYLGLFDAQLALIQNALTGKGS
jgi:ABC-type Zn uptake system ZnuABC Zn-binding protein ZnuA